jgi:predicted RNase H-like HicB family nuclease
MRSPEFIEKDTDTTYMAFLRLLREYHSLQADAVDAALEREKLKND